MSHAHDLCESQLFIVQPQESVASQDIASAKTMSQKVDAPMILNLLFLCLVLTEKILVMKKEDPAAHHYKGHTLLQILREVWSEM